MSFLDRYSSNRRQIAGASVMLLGTIWLQPAGSARAQDSLPHPVPGQPAALLPTPSEAAPEGVPVASVPREAKAARSPLEVRYDGTPTPGARIELGLVGASDPQASYQWVQIEGPPVTIDDAAKPKIQITIPADARRLGFLLTMNDASGQRTARFSVPIGTAPRGDASAANEADAGDDQIGLVGRRITLNGAGGAAPREGVAYRWFQLGGPKVEKGVQDRHYYTFVPKTAGVYRFGLVVASDPGSGVPIISEMDEVLVTVGELPTDFGGAPISGIAGAVSLGALDQMLQGPGSIGARATLDQVTSALEAIAARTSLYTTFADLSSEMIRRIDAAMPADPSTRQYWSQGVFAQLTQHITSEMLTVGLDLRVPHAVNHPLTAVQQEKLHKLFSYYVREFRSRTQSR